jgi:hypothetical protein
MNQSVSHIKEGAPKNRWGRFESVSRRTGRHGGMAWSAQSSLLQPQDGAFGSLGSFDDRESRSRVTDIGTRLRLGSFGPVVSLEPEDARITGGTRSLVRRLLGLNIIPRVSSLAAVAKPAKRIGSVAESAQVA